MTRQNKHMDQDMLVKYLLGETTPHEFEHVNSWLLASDENKHELDMLEMVWIESGKLTLKPLAVDVSLAWGKMSGKIDASSNKIQKTKIIDFRKKTLRITASIAAVFVLGVVIFGIMRFSQTQKVIYTDNYVSVEQQLPDGSNITLNKHSKITYPEKFTGKTREVKLAGEAFFKVEPDSEHPFIVDAGKAKIKVLGTQFNVKILSDENVEVTVTEGKVELFSVDSLLPDTSRILLVAGNKGKVNHLGDVVNEVLEPKPDELFWMSNTLIFNDTELSKVFQLLEQYFKVTVNVSNPKLYHCPLTSTFSNNTPDEILEIIAFTFNLELQKQDNFYLLEGDDCGER